MLRKISFQAALIIRLLTGLREMVEPLLSDDRGLSVKEAAARLGYSIRHVQRWMESGAISYIQIGTTRFFSERYINQLLITRVQG